MLFENVVSPYYWIVQEVQKENSLQTFILISFLLSFDKN